MKKRLALLVVSVVSVLGVNRAIAQDDCNTNLSLFYNDAKVKNYEAAYEPWKKVFDNCAQDFHVATYVYGEKILKYKIENDEANKQTYIDLLIELYQRREKNYPTGKYAYPHAEAVIDIIKLKNDNGMITDQEIYDTVKAALAADAANFNSEGTLYLYFTKAVALREAGTLDLQTVFDTYDDVTAKLQSMRNAISDELNPLLEAQEAGTLDAKGEKRLKNDEIRISNYDGIQESMDNTIAKIADCPALIQLYTKNFDANKDSEEWLARAANRLDSKDCTSDPMYAKIVEQLHSLKPSARSAYFLGILAYNKGDKAGAKKWFKEAVELEQDKYKKADYLYKVAQLSSGQEAASYASQVLKYNPSKIKAYGIISRAYAASANSCGNTKFEKLAVYWLAADTARKAGDTKLAQSYEALAPTKTMIFSENMQGKTVSIGCWINKTIKVPNL